jgi:hypothetical protein
MAEIIKGLTFNAIKLVKKSNPFCRALLFKLVITNQLALFSIPAKVFFHVPRP